MRYIKKISNPRLEVFKIDCDICKKQIKNRGWDASEVTIQADIGECFPECDNRGTYEIDCCDDCFLDSIKPLIEEKFNIKFRERDTKDYYQNDKELEE